MADADALAPDALALRRPSDARPVGKQMYLLQSGRSGIFRCNVCFGSFWWLGGKMQVKTVLAETFEVCLGLSSLGQDH